MNTDFKKVMANKSDSDLIEIDTNYKKYTKDALVALLSELKTRNINTPNIIDIENRIKELEVRNGNVGKITGQIELHPNIEKVSKLLLLGIPISIVQLAITALYFHQTIGSFSFSQIFGLLSFSLIFVWIVIIILAAWIKSGSSLSRIIIATVTVYAVFTNIRDIVDTDKVQILSGLVSIVNLFIDCYILYLLFNKHTSNWYKSKPKREEHTAGSSSN